MPHVAKPKSADEMTTFAFGVFQDITRGRGTPHARARRLADVLAALAKENYEAGVEDGKKAAAVAPPPSSVQLVPAPVVASTEPDV